MADLLNDQGAALLKELNLITPSTSVSSILFLHGEKIATVTQLAKALDVTHQMATQRVSTLVNLALVKRDHHPVDKRSRIISLSDQGQLEAKILLAFTEQVSIVIAELFVEIDCDLKIAMLNAEHLLKQKPLAERIAQKEFQ